MVPEHVAISEHDKQELLKKYSIHEEQLPRLRLDDPICKYYGFKRGQVYSIQYNGMGRWLRLQDIQRQQDVRLVIELFYKLVFVIYVLNILRVLLWTKQRVIIMGDAE